MEKAISSDLIRGHIDTIILHSLLDGDKFAQQISDSIEAKSEKKYSINQATLYSSLKRLENLKHVNAYWNDSENGRRRFFKLTDLGKKVVEDNLSNWSYSREIIDKLMDFSPTPIYKTQIVEKIVEKVVEKPVPLSKPIFETEKSVESYSFQQKIEEEKPQQTVTTQPKIEEPSEQEINFRNILNGLIHVNERQNDKPLDTNSKKTPVSTVKPQVNETVKTVENAEKPQDKPSFNDSLYNANYNSFKSSNRNGTIDYGEMVIQAEKEGYKLRFSSKETKKTKGNVYINKTELCASLVTFLLFMLECFVLTIFTKNVIDYFSPIFWVVLVASLIFPIIKIVFYTKRPKKTSKEIKADSFLTALIVVFNLLLITFALDILIGVDFKDIKLLILTLLIPSLIYIDIFAYYLSRFLFSKSKRFIVTKSK